jgi:hypothetical protein
MALDTLGQDILDVLANHAPDLERAVTILQAAETDGLLKAALAVTDPVAKRVGADFLARLDHEFSQVAAQAAAPQPEPEPESQPEPEQSPEPEPQPDTIAAPVSDTPIADAISGDPRLRH